MAFATVQLVAKYLGFVPLQVVVVHAIAAHFLIKVVFSVGMLIGGSPLEAVMYFTALSLSSWTPPFTTIEMLDSWGLGPCQFVALAGATIAALDLWAPTLPGTYQQTFVLAVSSFLLNEIRLSPAFFYVNYGREDVFLSTDFNLLNFFTQLIIALYRINFTRRYILTPIVVCIFLHIFFFLPGITESMTYHNVLTWNDPKSLEFYDGFYEEGKGSSNVMYWIFYVLMRF